MPPPPERQIPKLSRARLSDRANQELKRSITSGAYPPGSRLPAEKVLAEQLGVTRLTVREALSQLSAAGFVETRHGSGTYVLDLRERANLGQFSEMLGAGRRLTVPEQASLMEFRAIVMNGFAEAIVARAEPAHVDELRALLAEAEEGLDPEALAEVDYRFNETLARASGNTFFAQLMRSMRDVHLAIGAVVYREREREAIVATLEALVSALEKRQRARVAKVLATYVEGASSVVAGVDKTGRGRKKK